MKAKPNVAVIATADWLSVAESTRINLANTWRLLFALVLIALEFSNLVQFATFGSRDLFHTSSAKIHLSSYSLQALGYLMVVVVTVLNPRSMRKLFAQPIFRWAIAAMAVFTWGMLIRSFNPPVGLPEYDVVRVFLLRLNGVGFMLICVMMFEGEMVLGAVKRAVALTTLFAIAVNLCQIMHLWIFSTAHLDINRAVGLQDDPNAAGMAVVFGCVIGLTAVPRRWRELFVLAAAAGVASSFSREAMAALLVVIAGACLGRAVATPRLLLMIGVTILVIITWNLSTILEDQSVLSDENLARLSMGISDASAHDHARLAEKALEQFEKAPLLGNGFGTTAYWGDFESHNLFLSFMADHGILGVLLIPALLLGLARRSWDYYAFAGAFVIWCMFNHNLFDNPFGLITLAIMASQRACLRSSFAGRNQFPRLAAIA